MTSKDLWLERRNIAARETELGLDVYAHIYALKFHHRNNNFKPLMLKANYYFKGNLVPTIKSGAFGEIDADQYDFYRMVHFTIRAHSIPGKSIIICQSDCHFSFIVETLAKWTALKTLMVKPMCKVTIANFPRQNVFSHLRSSRTSSRMSVFNALLYLPSPSVSTADFITGIYNFYSAAFCRIYNLNWSLQMYEHRVKDNAAKRSIYK